MRLETSSRKDTFIQFSDILVKELRVRVLDRTVFSATISSWIDLIGVVATSGRGLKGSFKDPPTIFSIAIIIKKRMKTHVFCQIFKFTKSSQRKFTQSHLQPYPMFTGLRTEIALPIFSFLPDFPNFSQLGHHKLLYVFRHRFFSLVQVHGRPQLRPKLFQSLLHYFLQKIYSRQYLADLHQQLKLFCLLEHRPLQNLPWK